MIPPSHHLGGHRKSAHTGREQLTRAAADDLRTEKQRNTPEKGRETCQCCRNLVREEQSSRKSSGCYSNGGAVDAVCGPCRPSAWIDGGGRRTISCYSLGQRVTPAALRGEAPQNRETQQRRERLESKGSRTACSAKCRSTTRQALRGQRHGHCQRARQDAGPAVASMFCSGPGGNLQTRLHS